MTVGWLLHTSALARSHLPEVTQRLARLLRAGVLYTCPVLDLEALTTATSPSDHRALLADRRAAYRAVPVTEAVLDRAVGLQGMLATGPRCGPAAPATLVVVATAQLHQLGVLHYDADVELVATTCGVPQRTILPLGSVP